MKLLCSLALLTLAGAPAVALPPLSVTVHNLNTIGDLSASLNPRFGVVLNNQMFFVGGAADRELWVATLAGTGPFLDLAPGTLGSAPSELTLAGSEFFFTAKTADHGRELWVSDGTVLGTTRLTDLNPGPLDSNPTELVAVGGQLFFRATDDGTTYTLWRTDLTTHATVEVRSDVPVDVVLVAVGAELFFIGTATDGRDEVWKSDGSAAGTVTVTDTNCLAMFELVSADDRAFFTCDRDLYVTDGTAGGTLLLRHFDSYPPNTLTVTRTVASHGAPQVYFSASDDGVFNQNIELWVSDGTVGGTVPMPEIVAGTASSSPSNFFADQGELLFGALDGTGDRELYWTSGGSISGADLNSCGNGSPANYLRHGGFVYFQGCDCAAGCELFRTNRTVAGTTLVKDLEVGAASGGIIPLASTTVGLLFSGFESGVGSELWRTTGTAAGTVRLTNYGATDSNPVGLVASGQGVRFAATQQNGNEPWWAATHLASVAEIADLAPGNLGSNGFRQGAATTDEGITIFAGSSTGSSTLDTLWRTDGTVAGTFPVMALEAAFPPTAFTAVGRLVFFVTGDAATGRELWRTDGTEAGTFRPVDILPGTGSSNPSYLVASAGFLYFAATDPSFGTEAWSSDGSTAGTTRITDIEPGAGSSFPNSFVAVGGGVYFSAFSSATGVELWTWQSGITTVLDVLPGAAGLSPSNLVPWGSGVAFTARNANFEDEIWKSDGTVPGTVLLVPAGTRGGAPELEPLAGTTGGLVYFADLSVGYDLYVASGTPGVSTFLGHFDGLVANPTPRRFDVAVLDGVLYFGARRAATGEELWRTDGTVAGTEVLDLVPGPASSTPQYLVTSAGHLYFAGNNAAAGRELYDLVTVPLFADNFETGNTSGWDLASP